MPSDRNPPKKEAKEKKPKNALDHATDLVSPSLSFAKGNFRELFIKYLKVDLASAISGIGLFIILGLLTIGFAALLGAPLTSMASFFAYLANDLLISSMLIIWSLLAILFIGWIIKSIELTKYVITSEQFVNRYSGIWQIFNMIKVPVLGMILLNFAIIILAIGIPLLILYLLSGMKVAFIVAFVLLVVWILFFLVIYHFLSQFWKWEIVVGGKPVVESLKRSIDLVWKNVIGVIIFDLLIFFGALIIALPFIGLEFISQALLNIALIPSMITGAGMAVWLGFLGIYVVFRIILSLLRSILIEIVILPYNYSFWARIRQKPTK